MTVAIIAITSPKICDSLALIACNDPQAYITAPNNTHATLNDIMLLIDYWAV